MPAKTTDELLASLSREEVALLRWRVSWRKEAREKQLAPDIRDPVKYKNWKCFLALTGRGWGKTAASSNWLGQEAALTPNSLCALIAPTFDDCRYTNFEGKTGLLSVIPEILITDINKSLPSVRLWNGSTIRGFAADTPERLRGPQHHRIAADELGSWMYPEDAWSNLKLGLRLGPLPRIMCTTTPRPKQFIKQVMKEADVLVTGSLYENKDNLPESFIRDLMKLEGSRLARQEIYGEVIEIEEMGIIKRSDWRLWPHDKPLPRFQFIVMSIDAATTEKDRDSKTHDPDFSACSVWGMFEHLNKRRFMLLDFWQERMGLPDLIAKVKKERQVTYGDIDVPAFKPTAFAPLIKFNNFGRRIDLILIEQQGGGRQLVQMLGTEGILCHEYNPGRLDKLQRLHMVSPAFAQGLVYAVESETILGRPKLWTEEIVSQMCSYAGKGSLPHDDALDCGVGALRYLIDNHLGPMTVEIRPDGRRADEGVEFVPPALEGNPYSE